MSEVDKIFWYIVAFMFVYRAPYGIRFVNRKIRQWKRGESRRRYNLPQSYGAEFPGIERDDKSFVYLSSSVEKAYTGKSEEHPDKACGCSYEQVCGECITYSR